MKQKIIFFLSLFIFISSQAQTQFNLLSPKNFDENAGGFTASNGKLFLLTEKKILVSTDSGESWNFLKDINSGTEITSSDQLLFVVGKLGLVQKSTDNGQNWQTVNLNTTENLNNVFIFNDTVVIVGSRTVFRSNDKGINWTKTDLDIFQYDSVVKSYFISPEEAHFLTSYGDLYKTTNGGINSVQTYDNPYVATSVNGLYFYNSQIGFANAVNKLLKTTNGGQTWVLATSFGQAIDSQPLYSFFFTSPTTGFAVGQYGYIFKTTNGGNTWQRVSDVAYFAEDGNNLNKVYFANNIGYIIGDHGKILKSTNQGENWVSKDFSYDYVSDIQKTNNKVYVTSGKSFYSSTDEANWTKLGTPTVEASAPYIMDSQFMNDDLGYALVGNAGGTQFSKSTNGGVTWNLLDNTHLGFNKLHFFDTQNGLRYSEFGISLTKDGGTTWQNLHNFGFFNFKAVDENTAFGYNSSRIMKTTDKGVTWTLVKEAAYFSNMYFANELIGYYTEANKLYKTYNGGTSWELVKDFYSAYNLRLNFLNANEGIAFDYNGTSYQTFDGGINWNTVTVPKLTNFFAVGRNYYVAGANGIIYKSNSYTQDYSLKTLEVTELFADKVKLNGYGSSNVSELNNIKFQYGENSDFDLQTVSTPSIIAQYNNSLLNQNIEDLKPETTYYFRISATNQSGVVTSTVKEFTTLPLHNKTLEFSNIDSNNATANINIKNNAGSVISDIKIIYGLSSENLILTKNVGSDINTYSQNILNSTLENLEPDTIYFAKLQFTQNNVIYTSDLKQFKTAILATEDLNKESSAIYPNPVKDILHITNTKNLKSISIISTSGNMVKNILSAEIKNGSIDLRNLTKGNYVVILNYDNKTVNKKIIKQ